MNNYSWLHQKLHKLALSSQFMREVAFDYESFFSPPLTEIDNHVFIAGLARSGTTILLNALYDTDEFASLSYADMPFILAPNLWSKLSINNKDKGLVERAHGDGIKVSTESPEAFEEVFWKTFDSNRQQTKEKFKTYVKLINYNQKKNRYLSKNNQNIRRLELIATIFPKSKILIPFRDPVQQACSLLTQHKRFIDKSIEDKFISDYMILIGHSEFGPNYIPIHNKNLSFPNDLDINHWIEQWYLVYKGCYEILRINKNIKFISYEKLCSSFEYWSELLKLLEVNENYEFTFKKSNKDFSSNINKDLVKEASSLCSQLEQLTLR